MGKGANNFSGNKDPLILVNGQPMTDVSSIPTSEIKLIWVISKGSETAQYGLRGTNGVILIDLK
ncbi:TonB-dependent receptor plug domain-containing protein [Maribacter algicola]|uniref:TonB-dependent receptor plug domain-containing protein n=1 Tax=Meishania litoralis TaxID=3434685 RepID=A0ACC7LMK1_9FLAO